MGIRPATETCQKLETIEREQSAGVNRPFDSFEVQFVCNCVSASYFYHIADFLVKNLSYVRGKNLRGAPYDFRKAPSEFIL